MSRRQTWRLLHTVQKSNLLRMRSVRHISFSPTPSAHPSQNFTLPDNRKRILTPQVAHSTLLNCPSDLIAFSLFIWFVKQHTYFPNGQAIDHMVCVVSRLTSRHKTVGSIVRELNRIGVVTQPHIFLLLLRIYWRGRMYPMFLETFQLMETLGFEPNLFARNALMDVCFKVGGAEVGIKVLNEIPSPNFLSFSIALSNLCKLNDLINAVEVIQMMMKQKLKYYPNVETFEMLLNCFCKVGRLRSAYQLLGLMITLGISLSVNTWSILVQGFVQLHQPVMAENLLDKMVGSGCSPNVVTYTTLVKGLVESRMFSKAFQILQVMEHKGCATDLVLCNVLIDSLAKIGQHDKAIHVYLCLSKWNLVPDSYTLCSLLPALCFPEGFDIVDKLTREVYREADIVVCNSLLNYFVKAGLPFLAVHLYVSKDFIPDKYSFTSLLRGLCRLNRINEAINVYNGFIKSSTGLDPYFHTVMMAELIRLGHYNKAIRLFRRAITEHYPLDVVSYSVAIHGLLKGGRTTEASALYDQMKGVGLSPNARTYRVMFQGFSANQDTKMVKMLLEEVVEAAVQLDYRTRLRLTRFLFKSDLSSSCIDQLKELWNLVPIPDDTRHEFDGPAYGVNVCDLKHSPSQSYLGNYLFVDSCSSDDLSDVAASVG